MNDYKVIESGKMTLDDCAKRWKVEKGDIAKWCRSGYLPSALKQSTFPFRWLISADEKRPIDQLLIKEILWQILECSNNRITRIDLTAWGVPACDVEGCLLTLFDNSYLDVSPEASSLILTSKAFEALGRNSCQARTSLVPILEWTAEFTGTVAGELIRRLVEP